MVMRNLGLFNAKDTIVGNNSVRGVSGGERRRVTLGKTREAGERQRDNLRRCKQDPFETSRVLFTAFFFDRPRVSCCPFRLALYTHPSRW